MMLLATTSHSKPIQSTASDAELRIAFLCEVDESMNIRPFENFDSQAVIDLWTRVFGNSSDHNAPKEKLRRKIEFGDQLFFVATHGDCVVGTVMGGYDGHRGWVYALCVHPGHRRKGIATKMMQHLESYLNRLGCPKVNLQVRETNQEVLAFYQALGYQIEDRISMGKRLHSQCQGSL